MIMVEREVFLFGDCFFMLGWGINVVGFILYLQVSFLSDR